MTDLVERLRALPYYTGANSCQNCDQALKEEAADALRQASDALLRMREALEEIAKYSPRQEDCDPRNPDDPYILIARFCKRHARSVLSSLEVGSLGGVEPSRVTSDEPEPSASQSLTEGGGE